MISPLIRPMTTPVAGWHPALLSYAARAGLALSQWDRVNTLIRSLESLGEWPNVAALYLLGANLGPESATVPGVVGADGTIVGTWTRGTAFTANTDYFHAPFTEPLAMASGWGLYWWGIPSLGVNNIAHACLGKYSYADLTDRNENEFLIRAVGTANELCVTRSSAPASIFAKTAAAAGAVRACAGDVITGTARFVYEDADASDTAFTATDLPPTALTVNTLFNHTTTPGTAVLIGSQTPGGVMVLRTGGRTVDQIKAINDLLRAMV